MRSQNGEIPRGDTVQGIEKEPKININFKATKNLSSLSGAFESGIHHVTKQLNSNKNSKSKNRRKDKSILHNISSRSPRALSTKMPMTIKNLNSQRLEVKHSQKPKPSKILKGETSPNTKKNDDNHVVYKCICKRKIEKKSSP